MRLKKDGKLFIAVTKYAERKWPKGAGFRWDRDKKLWYTDEISRAAKLVEWADSSCRRELQAYVEKARESRAASYAKESDIEIPTPEGLQLLPYQAAGVAYAKERQNTLIADEMGLGKTIQAIGLVNAEESIHSVLILCPASLRLNWKNELEKWLVRPAKIGVATSKEYPKGVDIMICNYDMLPRYKKDLHRRTWDLLVCDESHALKNPKAQRTALTLGGTYEKKKGDKKKTFKCKPIPARRKLFLTGTPVMNKPIELFPVLNAIAPEEFSNYFQFARRYAAAHKGRWGWTFDGASNLDELSDRLRSTVMIRRLKTDVLHELPKKMRQIVEIPANGCATAVQDELNAWEARESLIAELKAAVELSKASSDPDDYKKAVADLQKGAGEAGKHLAQMRVATALAKLPYVFEHVRSVLDSGTEKVVLFSHHHVITDALLDHFQKVAVKLDGRDSMLEREDAVNRFQNDPDVKIFIGGLHAAGVGLTLTAASHVIFVELDYVPANISQAEDRCHRIGQGDSVLVQHLVLEDSVDSRMAQTIVQKQEIIDQALGDFEEEETEDGLPVVHEVEDNEVVSEQKRLIAAEAVKLSGVQIRRIHTDLRYLASVCDGAVTQDGMGFNRVDTIIGRSLAASASLTPKQAALGKKLTKKYAKQLKSARGEL